MGYVPMEEGGGLDEEEGGGLDEEGSGLDEFGSGLEMINIDSLVGVLIFV